MSGLALGIDIGTSGIRTAVLNENGTLLCMARAPHEVQDPYQIDAVAWWRAVQSCIAAQGDALQQVGRNLSEVTAIAVDGTSGTMVLTDDALRPVTRALMYNSAGFDAEAAQIARHAPDIHITKGANSALARALRLQGEDGAKAATKLLHQADFIAARLIGGGRASDHNNALKLGFDPETERWPAWFPQTGLRLDLLPHPHTVGAPVAQIDAEVAQELGLSSRAVIHAGTTDSIAAFLAAAPLRAGAAVTSLGTTLAIKIVSASRIDDPVVGLYSHRLGDVWLTGGASNTGGGVLASMFDAAHLGRLSAQIDPDRPSALDYYPLLQPGERFPINDPLHPPRMTPRPTDDVAFLHGLLESIARIEAQCYAAIVARGGAAPEVLFTAGGGASNATWTKIRARVLGITPQAPTHSEAAIGAASLCLNR
ncbi:MAG: FGGY-family carbohydrate kinase [Sulfitobacter sp.]